MKLPPIPKFPKEEPKTNKNINWRSGTPKKTRLNFRDHD